MGRIEERKKKADGNALDLFVSKRRDPLVEFVLVDLGDHVAVAIDAARHTQAQIAWYQRRGFILVDPVDQFGGTRETANLQNVAEVLVGDQGRLGAFSFDHRVGGNRRAVTDPVDLAGLDTSLAEQPLHALDDGLGPVLVAVEDLGDRGVAGLVVDQDDIGKRATDIDTDTIPWTVSHRCLFHTTGQRETVNLVVRPSRAEGVVARAAGW